MELFELYLSISWKLVWAPIVAGVVIVSLQIGWYFWRWIDDTLDEAEEVFPPLLPLVKLIDKNPTDPDVYLLAMVGTFSGVGLCLTWGILLPGFLFYGFFRLLRLARRVQKKVKVEF